MKEMTMTEFAPITTQEEFNERIKARLAREREKWEKESGTEDLKSQLEAKDEEIAFVRREHYLDTARRAVREYLADRGVRDEGRIQRVMKLVDLDAIEPDAEGNPNRLNVMGQVDGVAKDLPELVAPRRPSGVGSKQPVLPREKPLTRDEVENMSEAEINSRWDSVKGFLAGERG
jgi:hypothetical protein